MNYGGNMPDWHQYNTSQTNEVTPSTQNVNSGHLAYIPGVSPSTLNAISLNSEGLNKHQNNANYNPRNYQSFNNVSSNSAIPNNSPLASMVQMQNCIGHYGSPNTRNPMLDNINTSVDPRNTTIGTVNDDIGYRSNQGPFNGPIGHLNGPNCNLNVSTGPRTGPGPVHGSRTNSGPGLGTNPNNATGPGPMYGPNSRHGPASVSGSGSGPGNMGPRSTNVGPLPSGKPGPSSSCIPCKGMCCNSDSNINYQQWEKFGSYQNNGSYRDNVHPSNYQIENRHFGNNCNFRKDNLDGKEVMGPVIPNASTIDHRRNFADYKYHKDHLVHRNYSTSSGIFHNYSMQGYNYSAEHQKYPYPVKEHTKTNNMNVQNSGMLKHQEQNFIAQQKFNNKQFQYQNGNMIPKGISTLNVNANMASSSQNPYFNSQYPRNISTEISHECQETTDNTSMVNRMQGFAHNSPSQHQVYQQKIAMQKFSIENHLRELGRIPGYQSHPKYKECILRYREILKLQQSSGYQSSVQQIPRVATPANTSMPPINLQFDQNGMLINSSYLPDNFSKLQHVSAVEQTPENMDRQNKDQDIVMANEKCQQSQQSEQLMIPQQNEHVPSSCAETFQKQSQFSIHKDYNQNQPKVQTSESHSFNILSTNSSNEAMMQQKASKEFANKPDLDVRQFLANWDETDDEEGTTNLPDTILSETTPVVVVSYENIDLSSKTQQGTEVPRKNSFCSDETLESGKDGETNIITAQDCLTISYSASDSSEIPKTSERTIGEGVVKPGSIIHCISNGPDEIPTIHIVDNLEISNILGTPNDQVIQTLEKQKAIPFFRESSNSETMALENTEQQDKDNVHVLSANYTTSLDNVDKDTSIEDSNISETATISMNNQELRVLSTSQKDNLGVGDNIVELKKQHSFEESHNPDDISLPDLPECTPISTTLNTPIHSDTEESSQNMEEDLSISTNPIEVMQNSPVISFTQLNSENKVKNMSLGTIELEFQKENRYKNNETSSEHIQEVDNFELSGNLKAKSSEAIKNKQLKSLGINAVRKKVCLIDGKENDTKIPDTCTVLTSMEYELDIRQKVVDREKNSDRDSSDYTHNKEQKSISRSTEAIKHRVQRSESDDNISSNPNLSPTVSDNESQASKSDKEMFRRRKIKTSTVSTNTNCLIPSELDQNIRKRAKEATTWEDKCINKYVDRNLSQKRDADHLKQSKVSDTRKFDDSSSSQGGEHSVCHMISQYKHYSAAVIKDNVILSDKRTHSITDRIMNEKSPEFPSKMNNTNTKDLPKEAEIRKQATSKAMSTLHESIQSQTSRLLQKDLKGVDGDVRYTAEEMRLLKEYRKKKEKLYQAYNTHDDNKNEKTKSKSHKLGDKICLEQNSISSIVSRNSENLVTQEEAKSHSCSKSLIKNTDFGIQVANVNLKIKDNDIGKELILGDKNQEHAKDPLEGIKIEINVSCTDRNVKGQEQNKRLLYDDRSLYEIDDSLSYSNALDSQRKSDAKEQSNNSKLPERAHKNVFEKSDAMIDVIETNQGKREAEKNLRITFKKDRRTSSEVNEEMNSIVPKEACSLISESQSFSKTSRSNIFCKDMSKTEVIKDTNYAIDQLDVIKSKSAISNTATVDANNKVKGKNKLEDDKEDNRAREDEDRVARMRKQSSTSFMNVSGVIEKEIASVPHSKASVKLPESNFTELRKKLLTNLNNLDFKFGKYSELDLDRDRRVVEELDEEESYTGKWKKPKIDDILEDCDMFQSSSGYVNPIFSSIDKLENPHTVPVYTTKDGKISYSPNRRFTYHELMMEARRRESYSSVKKSHYADTWNSYYSSKFRKMNKRKRHHDLSDKKKYEYKNTKCLYDRKKNYSDEFYGKNHVKYKDYIHSIRNDNAIWSDHYKMDKMYSSSDSDDQIIDRSKYRTTEVNNSKKDPTIENKGITISKLQKDDIFINELDLESKSKENEADDSLNKDKSMDLEETQMIQFQILDMEENNENVNCKNANNNCVDNYTSSGQSDIPSTSLQLSQEKQTVEYSVNESSMLNESEITSENVQRVEGKNSSNECSTDQTIDKVETLESEEKNVVTKIELLNKASLLDEQVSLCDLEKKKDDEKIISGAVIKEQEADTEEQKKEIDINVSNSQTFLEPENNFENVEDTESNNKSEINQVGIVGILEFENDITKKVLDPQTDSDNIFDQVSQESLDLERPVDAFNEIVEESEENIIEENILECEEEIVQFSEEVEISNEEAVNKVEEEDNEYLENSNNNLSRDTFAMNQEVSESRAILTEETINQEDNSKHISVELIHHQDNIDTNSDQINNAITEEKNLNDFSKTEIYPENENVTDIISNKNEIEIILSNIEEISVKQVITDNLKDEGEPNDLPTVLEHETKFNQESFEDKEMHILNTCCSIKNSPVTDVESCKDKTKVDEQKEEQIPLEQVTCKSLAHCSDSNIDMKAIPKLIIKKTDTPNSKSACSLDYTETSENWDKYDAKLFSELHPKIPKVIITKNRSRSATPVEIFQKTKSDKTQSFLPEQNDESMDVDNSDFESYTLKYNNCENKVPKVRIKLEDISSKDLKVYLKRKATKRSIPKVRIKKLKTQESKRIETKDSSETEDTDSDEDKNLHELMSSDTEIERTPKSKLKRQEDRSWSPEKNKGKNSNISKVFPKKTKRTKEEDSKCTAKYDTAISDELKKKFPQCIIEKIPKVIIKRTQIGAEFKCEISKSKKTSIIETAKWQPKVKLQRLDVLDNMVKDLKQSKITLSDKFDFSARMKNINNEDTIDNSKVKLSRSNSVSNLSPTKYKRRRFSDSSYMKVNTKSNIEFKSNLDGNVAIFKSDDSESKIIRKKENRKISSESEQLYHSQNNESEREMEEIITKHSFRNILTNEDNDMMVVKEEYLSFDTKESTPLIEDKFLDAATRSHNYNDNDSSIIKVDSSDESQTTIEILPASPNNSDDEAKNSEFESINRMDMTDAMPTQLELELELIDNNNTCSEVFMSDIDYASHSKSKYSNEGSTKTFFNEFQRSSQSTFDQNKYTFLMKKQHFERNTNDNFYCNDLLIKEVLAAKETLKKCLTRSETEDVERTSRPKTVAEKKQGLSFSFKDLGKSSDKSEEICFTSQNNKMKISDSPCDIETEEVEENCFKQHEIYSVDCPTVSTHRNSNVPEPTTISLKSSKTSINNSDLSNRRNSNAEKLLEIKSVKKTNSDSQKNNDNSNNTKVKEDNMPLLVPEFVLNFDSSSDRDSSRSPPVITNQEEVEHVAENTKLVENKVISQIEKIEENKKHSYNNCEMTIADIITQLAYHEKATIKHKKYCNLCERWFPTTSRHRRHLAGYQHRYIELTQRKSIHALFILFTGKPCPRLLPANVIRNDCSIGELTPLQIAVQDVAKCVEYIQQNQKTKE